MYLRLTVLRNAEGAGATTANRWHCFPPRGRAALRSILASALVWPCSATEARCTTRDGTRYAVAQAREVPASIFYHLVSALTQYLDGTEHSA